MNTPILRYFSHEHLPEHLQKVSTKFTELAMWCEDNVAMGPEKSAGLRKLLEAKDCMVRAALGDQDN